MAIDDQGLVHTDEEDEEEYVEDGEYEEDEELDDEGEVVEEELDAELDDDDAAEYIQGLQPLPRGGAASSKPEARGVPPAAPAWKGLQELPAVTQTALSEMLAGLKRDGRKQLTILLLGTSGVGKSSTANSLFRERVAKPSVFQEGDSKPTAISRKAADFVLTVIDTPSLQDAESVSQPALDAVLEEAKKRGVDAVIWVDRLDVFRVSSVDRQAMKGVTRMLGAKVWDYTLIGLTHGRVLPPTLDQSYEEFVEQRASSIRAALRDAGASGRAELPAVLIENSSRCDTNAAGQQVLPNEEAWLPALMNSVAAMASRQAQAFVPDAKAQRKADPNKRWRWVIPFVIAAQVAFKVFVLDRLLEEDGVTGDQYGPYDPAFVASERERLREDKETRRRRKEAQAEEKKRRKARDAVRRRAAAVANDGDAEDLDLDDEEDEDYDE